MNYVGLTERLVKSLVSNPDVVSVKEFPSDDENKVLIEVLVSEDDLAKVIGRSGKTINAIRTILRASSSLHDHKNISINVEGF